MKLLMKKRLYKDKSTGIFAGICSGIAQYFDIDPTFVRIIYVLLTLVSFSLGAILYIVLIFILPDKSEIGFTDYDIKDDQ
ncbi:MAG: PspC domain-containing protein [Eubacteriales bacterium]